jgi:hypothetical protein
MMFKCNLTKGKGDFYDDDCPLFSIKNDEVAHIYEQPRLL